MSTGLLVTLLLLAAGLWVMMKLVRGHGTRVRMRRDRPEAGRATIAPSLSPTERRRLYRRLGLDPSTLRNVPPRAGRLGSVRADSRRGDVD